MCAAAQTRPRLIALMGDNFGESFGGMTLAESFIAAGSWGDLAALLFTSVWIGDISLLHLPRNRQRSNRRKDSSMKSTVVRISLALLFCLGTFVTAHSVPVGQRDRHERQRCEKECQARYKEETRQCRDKRGKDRRECQQRADRDRRECRDKCRQ
jgi:hypothetical protein